MRSQEWLEKEFKRAEVYRKELWGKRSAAQGGNLKSEIEDYIYNNILTDAEMSLKEIQLKIKQKFQFLENGDDTYYLDDTIRCVHKEKGVIVEHTEAEWRHQIRLCLDNLERQEKANNPDRDTGKDNTCKDKTFLFDLSKK